MDARHFDALSRALSAGDSRRRLLTLLATLPLLGGLIAILDPEDADGKGRRKRRKKRHKHGKGRRRQHQRRKPCKPESVERTCAGKCGSVTNNCKKTVDCGSCDCAPACDECFTCQGAAGSPGTCVPQDAGTPCGDATTCATGILQPQSQCNGSGVCEAADPVPCAPYTQCVGNACASSCSGDNDCVVGSFCNASNQCVGDGGIGQSCVHGGQCTSGFCANGVCCNTACDEVCQACNLEHNVGTCQMEANGTGCGGGGICCGGTCQECCSHAQCSGSKPLCVSGACSSCAASPADCPADTCCDVSSGSCVATCPGAAPLCVGDVCTICSATNRCPDGQCCASDGSCANGTANAACGSSGACAVCTPPQTCGGGGAASVCGCTPLTSCPAHRNCGEYPDGCGGHLDCGACSQPTPTCVDNICRCTSNAECNSGFACMFDSCRPCATCAACVTSCASCRLCANLTDGTFQCLDSVDFRCEWSCHTNADCFPGELCVSVLTHPAEGSHHALPAGCGSTAAGMCVGVTTFCEP